MRKANGWARAAAVIAVCAGVAPPAVAQPPPPQGAYCPAPDLRVGTITIERLEVFEARPTGTGGWLASGANTLHRRTREALVRRELLLHEGDRCDDEALGQTERNLRALGLFRQVEVVASPAGGDLVDLLVRVRDAFSLRAGASYTHEGGTSSWDARIGEANLGGLGLGVALRRAHNSERDVASLAFSDPRLFGSRERLEATVDRRSDGSATGFLLARPFHRIDARWGHDLVLGDIRDHLRVYEAGLVVGEWERRATDVTLSVAARLGRTRNTAAWRLSAGYRVSMREYAGPANPSQPDSGRPPSHRRAGPLVGLHYLAHRFVERRGLIVPDRDTDVNLGLSADIGLFVSEPVHALRTEARTVAIVGLSRGWLLPAHGLMAASLGGQVEVGGREVPRSEFSATIRAWWPRSPLRVSAALLEVGALVKPEPGQHRYLGGTPGLRGYRQFAFGGSQSLLLVLEERRYLSWTPAGLFRPGLVVFAEGGVLDDGSPGPRGNARLGRVHADVGVGLRLAPLRSAGGAGVRIDFALPLERAAGRGRRPQVVVGYRSDF